MAAAQPAERVRLVNFMNIAMNEPNGALVKTSGGRGYNRTATSADFIAGAGSTRRGISCRISEGFAAPWLVGLVSAPHGQQQQRAIAQKTDYECLTFALCVGDNRGTLWVYENGKECGCVGRVKSGDYIEIVLNSENPPSIEYHINGSKQLYKSELRDTPIVFPLFPKICALYQGPLAEDLSWIGDPSIRNAELQAHIAELKNQLRVCEEEKQDLHKGIKAKQAEIEVLLAANEQQRIETKAEIEMLQAATEQQKKEMKAGSDALLAVTEENAQLLVRLEGAREASQAASEAEKESSSANIEEQSSRLAGLQTKMDQMREASRFGDGLQEQVNDSVGCQWQCTLPVNIHLGPVTLGSLDEELLGVLMAKAKLEVREMQLRRAMKEENPKVEPESQPPTCRQTDLQAVREVKEEKAHLEKQLQTLAMQNEQLQQRCAEMEEIQRRMRHLTQLFSTSDSYQKSEADSSEWEPLGSDPLASVPVV